MSKVHGEVASLPDRCRLVLVLPARPEAAEAARQAFSGGDVASVFLVAGGMADAEFQELAAAVVREGAEAGVAVVVADDSRVMGRVDADGLLLSGGVAGAADACARFSPKRMVGCGNLRTRHSAMEAAEAGVDFLFIGKLDGDIRPEAHPRNVELGEWCSEVMQIPVVVMGGTDIASIAEIARSGADFAALGVAVFSHVGGPAEAVGIANAVLEENSPRHEEG